MKNSEVSPVSRRAVVLEYIDAPGKTVILAGSFNNWQPGKKMSDKNNDGHYRCRLMLNPGEYQYKFRVGGEWRVDPANPNFQPNDFGSLNSVLKIDSK